MTAVAVKWGGSDGQDISEPMRSRIETLINAIVGVAHGAEKHIDRDDVVQAMAHAIGIYAGYGGVERTVVEGAVEMGAKTFLDARESVGREP